MVRCMVFVGVATRARGAVCWIATSGIVHLVFVTMTILILVVGAIACVAPRRLNAPPETDTVSSHDTRTLPNDADDVDANEQVPEAFTEKQQLL